MRGQVLLGQRFQLTLLRVLIDHKLNKLSQVLGEIDRMHECAVFDYLLLPTTGGSHKNPSIDWECVVGAAYYPRRCKKHLDSSPPARLLRTFKDSVCTCLMENCLVITPHNDCIYCIHGIFDKLDGNSLLSLKNGQVLTYKAYYQQRFVNLIYSIILRFSVHRRRNLL